MIELNQQSEGSALMRVSAVQHSNRISIPEIARRLSIGRQAVYSMLEKHIIPGIRLGKRWIVTRHAYETWERTAGMGQPGQFREQ